MALRSLLLLAATLWLPAPAAGDTVGRLFVTPAERAALDAQKRALRAQRANPQPDAAELELNGLVTGGGHATVWLNDEMHEDDGATAIVAHSATPRVVVHTRARQTVALKPGQAFSADTGEVLEGYQRGQRPPTTEDKAP